MIILLNAMINQKKSRKNDGLNPRKIRDFYILNVMIGILDAMIH